MIKDQIKEIEKEIKSRITNTEFLDINVSHVQETFYVRVKHTKKDETVFFFADTFEEIKKEISKNISKIYNLLDIKPNFLTEENINKEVENWLKQQGFTEITVFSKIEKDWVTLKCIKGDHKLICLTSKQNPLSELCYKLNGFHSLNRGMKVDPIIIKILEGKVEIKFLGQTYQGTIIESRVPLNITTNDFYRGTYLEGYANNVEQIDYKIIIS